MYRDCHLVAVNMEARHFWPTFRCKIVSFSPPFVAKIGSGCASLVGTTVFSAFKSQCQCQCECLDAVWRARFGCRRWTKQNLHLQIGIYKSLHLRPCRSCRRNLKVPTMLLRPVRSPAKLPSVCSGKKVWPFDPTCALADLLAEFWQLDSKPIFSVPSDVPASVPHSKRSQCCLHTIFDPGFIAAADAKSWTRISQLWKISCHSNDQSVSESGATMARHSFRNETSSLKRWSLYMVRWPLAKHTIEDTTLSKYFSLESTEVFRFCNIQRLLWKYFVPCSMW